MDCRRLIILCYCALNKEYTALRRMIQRIQTKWSVLHVDYKSRDNSAICVFDCFLTPGSFAESGISVMLIMLIKCAAC